ncbi:MAG: YafY family protein [Sedimenticola sp.]
MHDAERIYQIDHLLRKARQPISMRRLVEELEVSERTVRRDIAFMRDRLRAPIETTHSPRGYRYVPDTGEFELPGLWFRADELYALLAASRLLESLQPGLLSEHLKPLLDRFSSLLEKSGHSSRTVDRTVLLKTAPRRAVEPHHFTTVAGATLRSTPLTIDYHSRGRNHKDQRNIHPYRLLHYRDNWYLIAWCEKARDLRYFAIERIQRAKPLDIRRRPYDSQKLDDFIHRPFGIFGGTPLHHAQLRFTPERARWIADEIWHPDQQGCWDGDHYLLTLPFSDPTELIMEIMRFGAEVEVLGPPELREEVALRSREVVKMYENSSV